jgi:hypothetical protein
LDHNPQSKPAGSTQIGLIIVLAAGLLMAVYFGISVGQGDFSKVYVMLLMTVGIPMLLIIGGNYWVLLPFAFVSGLPAVPLGPRSVELGELWVVISFGMMMMRLAILDHKLVIFRKEMIGMVLFGGLTFFIFYLNPVGFALIRSSSFGARFYLKIGLAMVAFYILLNQRIEEKHCKWIVMTLLVGGVTTTVWGCYSLYMNMQESMAMDPTASADGFYTWHQNLRFAPMVIILYVFCRYRLSDLFTQQKYGWLFLLPICYVIVLLSGKREALATVVLIPFITAFLRGNWRFIFGWGAVAAVLVAILVVGQGQLFHLPKQAQRALAFLPGDWDREVTANVTGDFRKTLNKMAARRILERPWLGQGYQVTGARVSRTEAEISSGDHFMAYMMAQGSQWHNLWLGIGADFGMIAVCIVALILLQALLCARWVMKRTTMGSYMNTLAMMMFIYVLMVIAFSWVNGHSSYSIWILSWKFGLVLGIKYTLQAAERASKEPAKEPTPAMRRPVRIGPEGSAPAT